LLVTQTRRRGEALVRAIREAAMAELRAHGYADLTMEGVAERAQTGKAALYRRWPTKQELILDTLRAGLPDPSELTARQDVRTALVSVLTAFNHVLAGDGGLPGIDVFAGLYRSPELREAFVDQVVSPRLSAFERFLLEAVDRREIAPAGDLRLIARTGWSLVLHGQFLHGAPLAEDELTSIVDEIVLPLLRPNHGDGR
jgi:AcrR family transcriptional regulator